MDEEFRPKPKVNILGQPTLDVPDSQAKSAEPEFEAPLPHPLAAEAATQTEIIAAEAEESVINEPPITPTLETDHAKNSSQKLYIAIPKPSKKLIRLTVIAISVILLGLGGYYLWSSTQKEPAKKTSSLVPADGKPVSITLYQPKNLPSGYIFNADAKTIKENVLYFSVTGPKKEMYYITQQPIPANFDFTTFNKKFLNPDTFTTPSGTATVGPVGAINLGSIRTSKNTWIIINASETATTAGVETVARSFELAD